MGDAFIEREADGDGVEYEREPGGERGPEGAESGWGRVRDAEGSKRSDGLWVEDRGAGYERSFSMVAI